MKVLLQKSASTVLALGCALLIGVIIMVAIGENPIDGFYQLIRGAVGNKFNFGSTLEKFVPLLLTGLAYMVAERAGMFNMGVEGELYLGALAAAAIAIYVPRTWPGWLIVTLSIMGSMIVGALWALIPALLKLHLCVNEVCSTILFNYIAIYFTTFMVLEPMDGGASSPQSLPIAPQAVLPKIMPPSRANIGLFFALIILIVVWWFFNRTTLGYRINQTGQNPLFAQTMGINPKKYSAIGMMMSGALGGIAGAFEVLGIYGMFLGNFSNNMAFDGMLAALIANGSYIALGILSLFIGALKVGALGMERYTMLPQSLIDTIIACFILFATMKHLFRIKPGKKKEKNEGKRDD